jgi:glycolate oxidase FAD binding subunit
LPALLDALHATRARPSAVLVTTNWVEPSDVPGAWWIGVVFEEKKPAVEWQVATLMSELGSVPGARVGKPHFEPADQLIQTMSNSTTTPPGGRVDSWLGFKANLRSSQTAAFCRAARGLEPRFKIHAAGLNGIVWCLAPPIWTIDRAATILRELTELAKAGGGNVVVQRCLPEWKKVLPVWGVPPSSWELMRHVKKTLDPDNVFNPGRLFGDL